MKTFRDLETGLEWLLEDHNLMTWEEAMKVDIDGFRLPTRSQLLTLIDDSMMKPACNKPASILSSNYWTSTPYALDTTDAWYINFYNGYTSSGHKTGKGSVRLVRTINKGYKMKTFKDQETGLEWLLEDFDPMTWEEAMELNVDGFKLPTRGQILDLIDSEAIKSTYDIPPGLVLAECWTRTPFASNIAGAWHVTFGSDGISCDTKKSLFHAVLVRNPLTKVEKEQNE